MYMQQVCVVVKLWLVRRHLRSCFCYCCWSLARIGLTCHCRDVLSCWMCCRVGCVVVLDVLSCWMCCRVVLLSTDQQYWPNTEACRVPLVCSILCCGNVKPKVFLSYISVRGVIMLFLSLTVINFRIVYSIYVAKICKCCQNSRWVRSLCYSIFFDKLSLLA